MPMSQSLIDCYRAIEDASMKMLEAAQIHDWEGVAKYEGACAVLIEQLRHQALSLELCPDDRLEKARIMRRILTNDAQIRDLVEPWVSHLDSQMSHSARLLH